MCLKDLEYMQGFVIGYAFPKRFPVYKPMDIGLSMKTIPATQLWPNEERKLRL